MTWKQIETSREIRLWVSQIIVPTVTIAATMMSIPEVRKATVDKFNKTKQKIETKFKKAGSQ